jgi:RND family efflux transporter MFP subunit
VSVPAAAVSLEARFAEIVPVVDDNSRTFTARVHLPAHPALKLGMFGRAQFTSGSRKAIEVPESAVIERGQLDAVFVHADNKAHLRMVRLGKRHQGQVEILSGLKPDERVILHPRANLRDGDAF